MSKTIEASLMPLPSPVPQPPLRRARLRLEPETSAPHTPASPVARDLALPERAA
jgi:hypothetical protein